MLEREIKVDWITDEATEEELAELMGYLRQLDEDQLQLKTDFSALWLKGINHETWDAPEAKKVELSSVAFDWFKIGYTLAKHRGEKA